LSGAPRISVILVTDHYRTIRRVLDRLREQTALDEIELVLVLPSHARDAAIESSLTRFAAVRYVELASIHPIPHARAQGIRAASAPVIFLGETHSFPNRELAEALLAAHESKWDAVVPALSNANPESAWSWASFLMDYGTWHETRPAGRIGGGPTWNVAYRKALLMEIGDRLEAAMEHGDELAVWLHARNASAYFEPRARLEHANVERFRDWIEQRFVAGVLVAASRKKRWSRAKRLAYLAGSPLIPAVILYRLRSTVSALLREGTLPVRALPALVLGTVVRSTGEAVGYWRGATSYHQPRMDEFEIHKLAFTSMTL
jgi:hypothetical protein